ncbi:MAG: hypothetical protein QXJ06_00020 [Candidatus Aenigmatarchaeota archaeon]
MKPLSSFKKAVLAVLALLTAAYLNVACAKPTTPPKENYSTPTAAVVYESPTPYPTLTATPTATYTPTLTATPTATYTPTLTATPTPYPTPNRPPCKNPETVVIVYGNDNENSDMFVSDLEITLKNKGIDVYRIPSLKEIDSIEGIEGTNYYLIIIGHDEKVEAQLRETEIKASVVFLDTCHARKMEEYLRRVPLVVYASDEENIAPLAGLASVLSVVLNSKKADKNGDYALSAGEFLEFLAEIPVYYVNSKSGREIKKYGDFNPSIDGKLSTILFCY